MSRKALITGVTGQDGSYLAEFLLKKGYEVHGIKRRASLFNTQRVDHIYQDPHTDRQKFQLHYGDLTDTSNLTRILSEVQPDEVYNLGAQSHVAVSFEAPEYTADVDGTGTLRMLEAIRFLGMDKTTKFYQASTSELYGLVQETPQSETTPFHPRSPYAVAKLYSYWITVNYREAYGMYACNGILFNHESPRRGETFVTRKITRGLANIALGLEDCLYMGNIDSLRDWGHAKDYVRMQWMMLQQDVADDFVIATGVQYSVREFITWSAAELSIELEFTGTGTDEIATVKSVDNAISPAVKVGDVVMRIDPRYFRPAEVETLLGDPTKAKTELGWTPEITAQEMCAEMVANDLNTARRHALLKEYGMDMPVSLEGHTVSKSKKILVVGFSVSAETPGYIEFAMERADFPAEFDIKKIAIGGAHAFQLKHLLEEILAANEAHAVILEVATSTFRGDQKTKDLYYEAIKWMLHIIGSKGLGAAIFDIARTDVDPATDWAFGISRELCAQYNIPYAQAPFDIENVRDIVHPTDEGKKVYAEAFTDLVKKIKDNINAPQVSGLEKGFGAIPLAQLTSDTVGSIEFERSNFKATMAAIHPGTEISLTIPQDITPTGLSFLMGPTSGDLFLSDDDNQSRLIPTFDQHCHFTRFNMRNFPPLQGKNMTLTQSALVPETELVKGEKNLGPRVGYVGHVLFDYKL